jgi:hypothetical protein
MSILRAVLSLSLVSSIASAQPLCQSLWLDVLTSEKAPILKPEMNLTGYQLVPSTLIKPGLKMNSVAFKKGLAELVQMYSDTLYMSAGEKMSIEKGELFLAKRLDDNTTLELSYQGDLRSVKPAFRLVKAAIVKGNAQAVNLTKEPLNDNGSDLKLRSFILQSNNDGSKTSLLAADVLSAIEPVKNTDDTLSFLQLMIEKSAPQDRPKFSSMPLKTVEVPLSIEGTLLERFVKFAEDLSLMKRDRVRDYLGKDKLFSLWALSKVYSSYDFTKQVAKKQIYKYVLVGAAFYGVAMLLRDDMTEKVEKKIDDLALQSKMSREDQLELYLLFSDLHQPWHDEAPELSERIANSVSIMGPMEKMETFKKFREDLGTALIKEYKNKGDAEFYFSTGGFDKVTDTSEKVIADLEGAVINKEEFLFINLPKTKKIFVGVLRHSQKKGKVESIAYTVVSKKEASNLYDILLKEIQNGIQRSLPVQPAQLLNK